jgi:hypothetical protein
MLKNHEHVHVHTEKNPTIENNLKVELWNINTVYFGAQWKILPKQTTQISTQSVITHSNLAVQIHYVCY